MKIIHKVHNHVCDHTIISDIKILLERDNLWNKEVKNISIPLYNLAQGAVRLQSLREHVKYHQAL